MAFTDDATAFSTSDVLDVDDQVIHFDTGGDLIWTADGARFQGFRAEGLQIKGPAPADYFQVRFGTERGERRAYLGWSDDYCHCPGYQPSIVDVDVVDGRIVFRATEVRVPGN